MEDTGTNHIKILLLEDEPIIGQITKRTLTAEGFEVDVAVNGIIAKEKLASNRYEICLFDIRTPGMNGMQLFEYLEREHRYLTSRVIFTTGDSLSGTTKEFLERVGNVYLPKPYTPTQLRKVVKEALSKIPAYV